jgi:hypothetical protein
MDIETNSKHFYLKTVILMALFFSASLLLFRQINLFLLRKDFFMPTVEFTGIAVTLMVALSLTYSLILCSNNRYLEYLATPATIGLAAFLSGSQNNIIGFGIMMLMIQIFTIFSVFYVHRMKSLYIKFSPLTFFGFPAKSLLTIFGIYAAFTVFFNDNLTLDFNIGSTVSKLASQPVQDLVNKQIEDSLQQKITNQMIPTGIDIKNLPYNQIFDTPKVKAEEFIADQVNKFIEPYTNFVKPTIAVIVYFLFQFLAFFARLIFGIVVYPVFEVAKEVGFLKVTKRQIEKEELSY